MAKQLVKISIEPDALLDAARRLQAVHAALAHRHGEEFRRLERDIDAFFENIESPDIQPLETGLLLMVPGPRLRELLERSASLLRSR